MWYRHRGQPGHSMHSWISSAQVWIAEIVEFIRMLLVDETCAQGFQCCIGFHIVHDHRGREQIHLTWRRRPFWTGNQLLCAWFCLRQKCSTGNNFMSSLSDGSDFLSRSHSANDFADATLIDLSSGSQRHPFRHWWVHHGTDTIWTGCVLRCFGRSHGVLVCASLLRQLSIRPGGVILVWRADLYMNHEFSTAKRLADKCDVLNSTETLALRFL